MMDQSLILGLALCLSIIGGLCSGVQSVTLSGVILFANWFIWTAATLLDLYMEPWAFAIFMDSVTAWALWHFCRDPILAASSAHLVMLHMTRALDWISYDLYYDYGWTIGLMQAGWVIALAGIAWRRKSVSHG